MAAFAAFADRNLGKQVVLANDTPNFIANRIGVAVMFTAATLMLEQGLTIEEVDALTGTAIGWPRTGTFRLADMVGIDILAHVAANFPAGRDAGRLFRRPGARSSSAAGWATRPARASTKRARGADGKEICAWCSIWPTFEYRPAAKARAARAGNGQKRRHARRAPAAAAGQRPGKGQSRGFPVAVSGRAVELCRRPHRRSGRRRSLHRPAMRAGFNWELGPFEMWDAAGVASTVARMKALGLPVSPRVEALLAAGQPSWYARDGRAVFPAGDGASWSLFPPSPATPASPISAARNGVVRSNPGASLVDLGDGIGCIELHSLKNAIGGDVLALISAVLKPDSDAVRDFAGFVIASDRENFSVGANLMQLLLAAQEGEWDELAAVIHGFQQMTAAIKFCPRPVVVAPFGLTLGGGAEICLHAARRQAHAETYIGLVEAGVGLIPAGGGTKEMLLRAIDAAAALGAARPARSAFALCPIGRAGHRARRAFETIALAKVSTSAAEARALGLLAPADRITMNRERLLLDAKAQAATAGRGRLHCAAAAHADSRSRRGGAGRA